MNDKVAKKRNRGINFTPEEELELVQNIINYQHVIESKELNAATRNDKDAAWNYISQIFNSKFTPRTVLQLRSKYDNMKTLARRLIAEKQNNAVNINSFRAANNIRSSIALNIVLSIINRKPDSTEGNNVIDCNPEDLNFSEESSSYSDTSSKPVSVITNKHRPFNEFEIKVKDESNENNCYSDKNESINNLSVTVQTKPSNNTLIINTPAEINKSLERNKNMVTPPVISESPEILNISDTEDKNSENTNKNRVIPKKRNPRFQELLRVKTEFLKRKMELIELENEERIKRMKREEELYEIKIKIMMLDMSIKQEELKKLQRLNS